MAAGLRGRVVDAVRRTMAMRIFSSLPLVLSPVVWVSSVPVSGCAEWAALGDSLSRSTQQGQAQEERERLARVARMAERFERIAPSAAGDLPYRLLRPTAGADPAAGGLAERGRHPLVVFFHGAGERGFENERSLTHVLPFVARSDFPIGQVFVLVPQCPPAERWVETDWSLPSHRQPVRPSHALQSALAIVDRLLRDEAVDPDRIYLVGLSMGGFAVWDALARWPDRFAAGIPICGGADLHTAVRLRHIPLRVYHGGKDTTVSPERSRQMVATLRALHAPVSYTEYARVGHGAWAPALQEADLLRWLLGQRRHSAHALPLVPYAEEGG